MKALKWWLWIVGLFYLIEGGGTGLLRLADPEAAAAIWTATGDTSLLNDAAMDAILVPGLFVSLYWLVTGALLLASTRRPENAGALVLTVVALELFAWTTVDISAVVGMGWPLMRGIGLLAVHLAIGVSGILALRASSTPRPPALGA